MSLVQGYLVSQIFKSSLFLTPKSKLETSSLIEWYCDFPFLSEIFNICGRERKKRKRINFDIFGLLNRISNVRGVEYPLEYFGNFPHVLLDLVPLCDVTKQVSTGSRSFFTLSSSKAKGLFQTIHLLRETQTSTVFLIVHCASDPGRMAENFCRKTPAAARISQEKSTESAANSNNRTNAFVRYLAIIVATTISLGDYARPLLVVFAAENVVTQMYITPTV